MIVTGVAPAEDNPEITVNFMREVFFNIETKDYFVNRYFQDIGLHWEEVKMGEVFTLVQGIGHHRIIY